ALGRPDNRSNRSRRNARSGGSDPGHHTVHAADELSRPAELGGASWAIEIGTADRDAAHWPSVWRRNVDRAGPCVSSCERSSPPNSSACMTWQARQRIVHWQELLHCGVQWEEETGCA